MAFSADSAVAATLPAMTLAWNPNPESNIAGYVVSYGTTRGIYTKQLDVGLNTSASISGLSEKVSYHIVVTAYNTAGQRSAPSSEIIYRRTMAQVNQPPNGWITAPATDGTIVAGQTVGFSAGASDPNGNTLLTYRWNFGEGSGIADSTAQSPGSVKFSVPGTYRVTLTVTDPKGLADPTPDVATITVVSPTSLVPRSGWTLKYVDSEQQDGYAAAQSFDGNPGTFWHTKWRTASTPPPHQIQINLGATYLVKGFQYLPRQDAYSVGDIGDYAFYVSADGVAWGNPVATGKFTESKTQKQVFSTPKAGKFVRLVSLKAANGGAECSVAELNILQGPPGNRQPVALPGTVTTTKNTNVKLTLRGSDADRNPLTYQIVRAPKHGTLSGNPPTLTYNPDSKFTGSDTFTYLVRDGLAKSKPATVTIRVKAAASAARPLSSLVSGGIANAAAATIAGSSAPSAAAPKIGTEIIGGLKYLTLTAAKPAVEDGLKRSVQVSPNLVDWFSGRNHTTVLTDNGSFLKVRDNTPLAPGKKRYIRLKTTRR